MPDGEHIFARNVSRSINNVIKTMKPIVTFLSDFGTRDGYAGSVKGILKAMAPDCEVIDISHEIPAQDVAAASWTLLNYYKSYPPGTVHLVVVDPGVGSERLPLIIRTRDYFFVGPDNGTFRFVTRAEEHAAFRIRTDHVTSDTFHGRDIFAPAAAKLVLGMSVEELAEILPDWKEPPARFFSVQGEEVAVKCIAIDHFGNIICGFHRDDLKSLGKTKVSAVRVKKHQLWGVNKFYAQKESGRLLALWNSQDYLEIAVNSANAAQTLSFDTENDRVFIQVE